MKLISTGVAIALGVSVNSLAAQTQTTLSDETALDRYAILETDEGVKTVQEIQDMESVWRQLILNGNCSEALPLLVDFSENANVTANVLRQGIEPYYDADRDTRERFSNLYRDILGELQRAERISNQIIRMRNTAWVEEARCLIAEGSQAEAVNRLYRALDYIHPVNEVRLWNDAREMLWEQVGHQDSQ